MSDHGLGESHEVDLVMQARFQDRDAFFLVHVENQASSQRDCPDRMFSYFARLTEKYGLPVYPVAVFSFDRPLREEPNQFAIEFGGETVLDFRFRAIQLNRLSWRDFINQPNPVAAALMAKMRIDSADRPRVKLECLRLLATLKLDPARTKLIGVFVENYLRLTAREMAQFEQEIDTLEPREKRRQWKP